MWTGSHWPRTFTIETSVMVGVVRVVYNGCRYMCMLFWASKVNYGIETVFTQVNLAVNWLNYLASPRGLCHLAGDKSNLLHHSPTMAEPRKSLWIRACGWELVDESLWIRVDSHFFVCATAWDSSWLLFLGLCSADLSAWPTHNEIINLSFRFLFFIVQVERNQWCNSG